MNIGTIVTPMERGQITLPKAYRLKLGITPGMPLNITLEVDKIVVQPFVRTISAGTTPRIIPAKYTRKQYLAVLKRIAKSKVVLWTKEDDTAREIMRKKERSTDW